MIKFYKKHVIIDCIVMLIIFTITEFIVCISWMNHRISHAFFGISLVVVIALIIALISSLRHSDRCLKNIYEYCKKTSHSFEELEKDFKQAEKLDHRIQCGIRWVFFLNRQGDPDVVGFETINHIESHTEGQITSGSQEYAYCYMDNQEIVKIPCSKESYKIIQDRYNAYHKNLNMGLFNS